MAWTTTNPVTSVGMATKKSSYDALWDNVDFCHLYVVKGWVSFNGTTAVIADDYNVSSITDNGTGNFTVNWDLDFADANYAVVGTCSNGCYVSIGTIAAGSAQITLRDDTGTLVDLASVRVIATGAR